MHKYILITKIMMCVKEFKKQKEKKQEKVKKKNQ